MVRAGLMIDGLDFDLDLHAVMHRREDATLENTMSREHYVPSRSQRL